MMQQAIRFPCGVPIHRPETFEVADELYLLVDSILCSAQQEFSSNTYENEERERERERRGAYEADALISHFRALMLLRCRATLIRLDVHQRIY
jgi:hypothetical protein